ncbi:HAMP domain-containing histidine kinase [Dactylosporangium sp. NBC_01737]|uniref:sensor histidine kinase n=1 Tax=Dactylosporangium sp. NBC_01737 TaxID=2975959 RepID=UPI002E14820B|nr:HAMP domain-containing histidine kinase [Dactylosporangium sp. NBC_01737]
MRLTVRVRLTLLYTVLFAAGGAVVVAIIYALVAASLAEDKASGKGVEPVPAQFSEDCKAVLKGAPELEPGMRNKCQRAFDEGVVAGARTQRQETLDNLLRYSVTTLAVVTVLSAAAGWLVAGRVLRPVHRITAAARAASEHNLAARVSLGGPRDELRQLADTFDAMLDRLEAAFTGQRRFIANASHELRTPLTVMRATIDVVLAKPAPSRDELLRMADDVRAAVGHAEALIEALLTLARTDAGLAVREPVDLATCVEDVLDGKDTGDRRLHLSLQATPTSGDPILLERLAANLVDNATRYNVDGGDVWITTAADDSGALLTVANTGPVIDPADAEGLFRPFHRHTRTGTDGFGLGLAIVASIATVHGGRASAVPNPGGGLRVTVRLPAGTVNAC